MWYFLPVALPPVLCMHVCEWGAGLGAPPWGSCSGRPYCPAGPALLCHCYCASFCVGPARQTHTDSSRSLYLLTCRFPLPPRTLHPAAHQPLPPNVPLLTANQRAGEAVDPAGRRVLWQGSRPCAGDKEMGILGGQALPGLLSPHGQVQNLARDGAWHLLRLQQSCECCTPRVILGFWGFVLFF